MITWILTLLGAMIGLLCFWIVANHPTKLSKAELDFIYSPLNNGVPNKINIAGSKHPGDVERGVRQMRRLYEAICKFREGRQALPIGQTDLVAANLITQADLANPDVIYVDNYSPDSRNDFYWWQTGLVRPNGEKKPVFPAPDEKDVWLVSELFFRSAPLAPDHQWRGLYLVLYSTGEIAKVRGDEVLHGMSYRLDGTPNPKATTLYFPGQTGIDSRVMPHAEFVTDHHLAPGN